MTDEPTPDAQALARLQAHLLQADPARNTDVPSAIGAAQQALALARALGREDDAMQAAVWLSRNHVHRGDYQAGMDVALQALRSLPEGAVAQRVMALHSLLAAASELGRFEHALDAGQEMMRITADGGDAAGTMRALVGLAMCFDRMGNGWQAVRLLSRALEGDTGVPRPVVLMASNQLCAVCLELVHSLRDAGADDERERFITLGRTAGERALDLLPDPPHPVYESSVLANLGEILLAQGDTARAEQHLRRSLALATTHALAPVAERTQASLNDLLLRQGQAAEAADAMQLLLGRMGEGMLPTNAMFALDVAYRACEAAGRHAQALAYFKAAERGRRQMMTGQMRAQSELFVTRTEAEQARLRAEHAQQDAMHERERAALLAADAERDPLTGLGNRRHLDRQAAELLPALQLGGRPLVLAQIDVDHFKQVNDRHGHAAGDLVLVALAQILRENTRAGDVLVRHGGEEFIVVLPGTPLAHAVDVCERLRERVEAHRCLLPDGTPLAVTISIGIAAAPPYAVDALVQQADAALYAAKRGGRNQLRLAPSLPADPAR